MIGGETATGEAIGEAYGEAMRAEGERGRIDQERRRQLQQILRGEGVRRWVVGPCADVWSPRGKKNTRSLPGLYFLGA